MKVALDTNIIVYAEGINDNIRREQAVGILNAILTSNARLVLPAQVLGEVFAVLHRKARLPPDDTRRRLQHWLQLGTIVPTNEAVLHRAFDLVLDHNFAVWDSVIFVSAAEAGCRVLLSEDMQDGFTWGGMKVLNPFKPDGAQRVIDAIGPLQP